MSINATQIEMVFSVMLHAAYLEYGNDAWSGLGEESLKKLGQAGLEKQRRIFGEIFQHELNGGFWSAGREAIAAANRKPAHLKQFHAETGETDLYVGRVYMVREQPPGYKVTTYCYTNHSDDSEGWLPGWSII
jgi:hypothetical protein